MSCWLDKFTIKDIVNTKAVLVTIEDIRGSTPREVGTSMLVLSEQFYGTIGGGNLEYQALKLAREQLAEQTKDKTHRFPLAASLGQCCGGWVNLSFKTVTPDRTWCEQQLASLSSQFKVLLFGAGHVGTALVNVLQTLPCNITWVDQRDSCFPEKLASNINMISHDDPVAEILQASDDSYCLIMTHNHTLDYELVESGLSRNFPYLGLIGSQTKLKNFKHRLIRRKYPQTTIDRIVCPIGIHGITGKAPEVIAISVAAQLLKMQDKSP